MELPVRKPPRLPFYNYSHAGAYFITICTENRKNILAHIVGGGAFDAPQAKPTSLGQIVEKYLLSGNQIKGLHVDKYVVMPNHIHIILFLDAGYYSASKANALIPHFVSTFKRFCHRDAGIKFFQCSYHDHIIRDEPDYQRIWQYINNNPALWEKDCFYTE